MSIQLELQFVEWRDIPGYDGRYEVSNTGLVRRTRAFGKKPANSLVASHKHRTGYPIVSLYGKSKTKTIYVHRLVMLAFVGASDLQVNHKNGIKHDNCLENLEYVTSKENIRHAIDILGHRYGRNADGITTRGERCSHAKLTAAQVIEIRELYKTGLSHAKIGKMYGVTEANVAAIVKRKSWKHI